MKNSLKKKKRGGRKRVEGKEGREYYKIFISIFLFFFFLSFSLFFTLSLANGGKFNSLSLLKIFSVHSSIFDFAVVVVLFGKEN